MKLQFLGANQQVTGSRYLLEVADVHVMIDCGMFQERAFLDRNWEQSPVDPKAINALLLTHAHLDHCGLIPRLVAQGFNGPIFTTEPTVDLAQVVMMDSAKIQEEDVAYKKKRHKRENRKSPHPYTPLYTMEDAQRAAGLFRPVKFGEPVKINEHVTATFRVAGHILGAATIELVARENGQSRTIVFSGDIGQWNQPLVRDPHTLTRADYIVMESTYGDRNHRECGDPVDQLADIVHAACERGGNVVIPTFAIERAQELMYHFSHLVHDDRIPDVPIFLDSPMAIDVTDLFRKHSDYLDRNTQQLLENERPPLRFAGLKMTRTVDESKAIADVKGSCVIMASSGMCTGGRIKHHLRANISRPDSTILFVGYQAVGTLGRIILDGVSPVRIHGQPYNVHAKLEQVCGFSAHGDRDDLIRWLKSLEMPPKQVFLTHGELDAANALAQRIDAKYGYPVTVPAYQQTVTLD